MMDVDRIRHTIRWRKPNRGHKKGAHAGLADGYRALGAAVIVDAVRVAMFEPEQEAQAARAWLVGDWFGQFVCDELDVQRSDVLKVVAMSTTRRR